MTFLFYFPKDFLFLFYLLHVTWVSNSIFHFLKIACSGPSSAMVNALDF